MFKNSPRQVPKPKLTWKIHVLPIESKQQLEMKKKQRVTANEKGPKQKARETRKPKLKMQRKQAKT